MSDLAFAARTSKPWLLITDAMIVQQDLPAGILLFVVDAALMTNLRGLYRELAVVLKFPDYFGFNFNSLDECLTDLEWLPSDGYLLLIQNSEYLLKVASDDTFEGFLAILDGAGEEWATPALQGAVCNRSGVPFHVVFLVNEGEVSRFQLRIKRLGFDVQRLGHGRSE